MVQLSEKFPIEPRKPVPAKGTVDATPGGQGHDFPQLFSEFSFRTLLTKGEVIGALGKVGGVVGVAAEGGG